MNGSRRLCALSSALVGRCGASAYQLRTSATPRRRNFYKRTRCYYSYDLPSHISVSNNTHVCRALSGCGSGWRCGAPEPASCDPCASQRQCIAAIPSDMASCDANAGGRSRDREAPMAASRTVPLTEFYLNPPIAVRNSLQSGERCNRRPPCRPCRGNADVSQSTRSRNPMRLPWYQSRADRGIGSKQCKPKVRKSHCGVIGIQYWPSSTCRRSEALVGQRAFGTLVPVKWL